MTTNPREYHFELPENSQPAMHSIDERIHPSFGELTRRRSRSRKRDVFEVIDTIVIHATAGWASQHAVDTWLKGPASAHWVIPDEDETQHGHFFRATVAEAKAAYHVGKVRYEPILGPGPNVNNRSLGIELVNIQRSSDEFSQWQVEQAAKIVRYAWAKYPNLKHVISHAKLDPDRRRDPGVNFPWLDFKDLVLGNDLVVEPDPLEEIDDFGPVPTDVDDCCFFFD